MHNKKLLTFNTLEMMSVDIKLALLVKFFIVGLYVLIKVLFMMQPKGVHSFHFLEENPAEMEEVSIKCI